MIGEPKSRATITATVGSKSSVKATVRSSTVVAKVNPGKIDIIHTSLPDYDGPYYIEPGTRAQTLLTTNKTMRRNLVIDAMHYTERPNAYGGLTVYIGAVEG